MGYGKKLQIECVGLYEHAGEGGTESLALEQLHAGLGIRHRQPDEELDQEEVDCAQNPAMPRVLDHGFLMALRADNNVRVVFDKSLEEVWRALWVDVEVAVQQHYISSSGCIETGAKRGTLASVALADDWTNLHMAVGRIYGGETGKNLVGAVPASIVHRHKLCVDTVAFE